MNRSAWTFSNKKRKPVGGKQGQAVWRNTETVQAARDQVRELKPW